MKERFQPCSAAIAGVLILGVAAVMGACNGTSTLAPPDGTACTKGTIAPGDSVVAMVDSRSCSAYSSRFDQATYRDDWTLAMKRNTAYVLRVRHVSDSTNVDHWNGDLLAFARNDAGDAVFATGWFGEFGPANPNGGVDQEMFLATTVDRTVSVRVESRGVSDTGAYTLSMQACPLYPMAVGGGLSGVDVTAGCTALALVNGVPQHVVLATFPGDTGKKHDAIVTRTAGTGGIRAWLTGPDLDLGCWTSFCGWSWAGPAIADSVSATPMVPGALSILIATDADSTATVTVGNTSSPFPAPHPVPLTAAPAPHHR